MKILTLVITKIQIKPEVSPLHSKIQLQDIVKINNWTVPYQIICAYVK